MTTHQGRAPIERPVQYAKARDAIELLCSEARQGSAEAVEELINVGITTALSLQELHRQNPEIVSKAASRGPFFPICYTWRRDQNKVQIRFAKSLPLARNQPFQTLTVHLDEVFNRIFDQIWQELERLRVSDRQPETKEQERILANIRALPPISKSTARAWARAFADYHVNFDGEPRMGKANFFYRFAAPERDLRTRRKRAQERLRARYLKGVAIEELDPISATKYNVRLGKILSMKVTKSSFKNRLAEVVEARLKRMARD